jgi:hypothetical protein
LLLDTHSIATVIGELSGEQLALSSYRARTHLPLRALTVAPLRHV